MTKYRFKLIMHSGDKQIMTHVHAFLLSSGGDLKVNIQGDLKVSQVQEQPRVIVAFKFSVMPTISMLGYSRFQKSKVATA